MNQSYWLRSILWIFLLALITGCQNDAPVSEEPAKPAGVPDSAVWVGGLDGGVFVVVSGSEDVDSDVYQTEIYYSSGDLAYKGAMVPSKPDLNLDLARKGVFQGWDGDRLYLDEGQYLQVN